MDRPADNIAAVRSDDAEMMAAIQEARLSIKTFLDAFMAPKPNQSGFLVKIAFVNGTDVEHIWMADLVWRGGKPTGVIAVPPARRDLKFKQRVEIDFRYLSDWMYVEDGKLVGGSTTRLLRRRMTPEERMKLDAESPFKID
jgi:uncharacterized protein YegJ (DUF2314 family)